MTKFLNSSEELTSFAEKLSASYKKLFKSPLKVKAEKLITSAQEIGRSFCGSWQGYHSRVYYQNFQPPPPGAHFSKEWGLNGDSYLGLGSSGNWVEYDFSYVLELIEKNANGSFSDDEKAEIGSFFEQIEGLKTEIESVLSNTLIDRKDDFLRKQLDAVVKKKGLRAAEILNVQVPTGQFVTRDIIVIGQGTQVPPHKAVEASGLEVMYLLGVFDELSKICKSCSTHIERGSIRVTSNKSAAVAGCKIFIGHGGSEAWRELKDFVAERLKLEWGEFNRVPIAGLSTTSRLESMLGEAAFALLVMTAEDLTSEGASRARQNVVHEIGLFQGRLGFTKAIVLLEEGCEEFSNIAGLGQIRFSKGKISAAFEEVRRVLEREGIMNN